MESHFENLQDIFDCEDGSFDNFQERSHSNTLKENETSIIPGHLASPIYSTEVDMICDRITREKMRCFRHKKIINELTHNIDKFKLDYISIYDFYPDPMKWIEDNLINSVHVDNEKVRKAFSLCITSTSNAYLQKYISLEPFLRGDQSKKDAINKELEEENNRFKSSIEQLYPEYRKMKQVEKIKDSICFKEIQVGKFISYQDFNFERDLSYTMDFKQRKMILIPTNLILSTLDKVQAKFGLFMLWRLSDSSNKYEGMSIFETGLGLYTLFIKLRNKMGQDFYSFIGSWEAYIVGYIIAAPDDLQCTNLLTNQYSDMFELLNKYFCSEDSHKILKDLAPKSWNKIEVLMWLELTGIPKAFGYPTLKADKLLDQIREYGTETRNPIDINFISDKLSGISRREMCFNFKSKNGKYPNFLYVPPELKDLLVGKRPPRSSDKDYLAWSRVVFSKSIDFNYCTDWAELVQDSACSVNRSSWAEMYDPCCFFARYGKGYPKTFKKTPIYPRRTVEHYLKTADEDFMKKLIESRDNGDIDYEDLICVECGKECELKVDSGRAFTKQTPPQRLIQTLMELNIAENIFPYVPQQSMTETEIRNVRRILDQVKALTKTSQFICLDLKKWCLFQRFASTAFMGKMYDELFGFKTLYQNSHLFFNSSNIMITNRLCPPDFDSNGNPIPGPFFLNDFIGGMEGMQQKKWTHIAECLILLTLEEQGIEGDIMGQGDNQVIILHFKPHETGLTEKRMNFLMALENNFKKINHELKEKETWYSSHLHEYSKLRIYKGVAVSSATKKASNIIPDINDGLFSITSSCSTINTITEGIARADYNPDCAFIINQFMMTNYLLRKHIILMQNKRNLSTDTVLKARSLLLCPADFGGLPLSTYVTHSIRGNDDKVSLWLHIMENIRIMDKQLFNMSMRLWQNMRTSFQDLRRLIEDVYSLNIRSLPSAENEIKNLTSEFLKSDNIKNPYIRKLHSTPCSVGQDELISALGSMRPMYPQLAHEVFKNSNVGTLIHLQSKLKACKTIEKLVKQSNQVSLVEMIDKKNQELIDILHNRLNTNSRWSHIDSFGQGKCPSVFANELRESGWKTEIVGVSKPPFAHQATVSDMDDVSDFWKNRGITVGLSVGLINSPQQCYQMYGPMNPYIGSRTKEKIKKANISLVEKTSFVKTLLQLGKLKSWCSLLHSPGLVNFIDKLMEEKKPLLSNLASSISLEDYCSEITSGNIFHRLKSDIDHDIAMVNCLASITGHYVYDSNSFKDMTTGGKDYSIFFQLCYVSCTVGLSQLGKITNSHSPQYLMYFECDSCSSEEPNPEIDLSAGYSPHTMDSPFSGRIIEKQEYSIEEARSFYSFQVGLEFGRNIDKNFNLHHSGDGTTHKEKETFDLSLNDLRLLDKAIVLNVAILSSHHCRTIADREKDVLSCLSEDKSFIFLSDRFMCAGLIDDILQFFGYYVTSHSTVSTAEGLSRYISSRIQDTFMRFGKTITSAYLKYMFIPFHLKDESRKCLRFIISHEYMHLPNFDRRNMSQYEINLRNGDIGLVHRRLNEETMIVNLDLNDCLRLWRSHDRTDLHPLSVIRNTKFFSPPTVSIQIDTSRIFKYHLSRSKDMEGDYSNLKILSHLARVNVMISSAFNKFHEIVLTLGLENIIRRYPGIIACLAEGSGSTAFGFSRLFPDKNISFNTLHLPGISNRDFPSDKSVPAFLAAGVNQERLIHLDKLFVGQTDITSERFLEKLRDCFTETPPALVTIDAESMIRSTNIIFIQTTVKCITKFKPAVIICKMFSIIHIDSLESQVELSLAEELCKSENHKDCTGGYIPVFIKPICSNPTGPEIYLVLISCNNFNRQCRFQIACWNQYKGYLGKNMTMLYSHISEYEQVCHNISSALKKSLTSSDVHKYTSLIPDKACNLHCPKFFYLLLSSIEKVHNHTKQEDIIIQLRSKGTTAKIAEMVLDFIYLSLYHAFPGRKLVDLISDLYGIDVFPDNLKNWRWVSSEEDSDNIYISMANAQQPRGNFFDLWFDGRMFLRDLGQRPNCNCSIIRYNLSKYSITDRILRILHQYNLIDQRTIYKYLNLYRES